MITKHYVCKIFVVKCDFLSRFYNRKLIAVPNDTEQEFKYTTNLHVEKSLKNENELRCFDLKK